MIKDRLGMQILEGCSYDVVVKTPDGRTTPITNRTFLEVDDILGHYISLNLPRRIVRSIDPIEILDIGGGEQSRAALELKNLYGDMVNVTNLNPVFPDTPSPEGVRKILGLAQQLPVADESKDLAYSSFVFNCLTDPQRMKAIGEVSRILKPGGTAAIFYGSDRYVYKNERGAISSMGLRSNLFYGREVGSVESSEFPILYLFKPYHRT